MTITIGTTTLNATSAYAFRYSNGKLVLKLDIPQTEIEHDDLKTLIKNNTDDITVVKDDGATETFSGFTCTLTILDHDDVYTCEVECVGEADRKIAELQRTLSMQEEAMVLFEDSVAEHTNDLNGINECLDEVAEYMGTSSETDDDISQCLDEIAEAIFMLDERISAIEEALENNVGKEV